MRADWDTAPDWASYVAQEMSGSLYWHEFQPRFVEVTGEWRSKGRTLIVPKVDRAAKDTLECRPHPPQPCPPDPFDLCAMRETALMRGDQ